jgi:hypothetical protein
MGDASRWTSFERPQDCLKYLHTARIAETRYRGVGMNRSAWWCQVGFVDWAFMQSLISLFPASPQNSLYIITRDGFVVKEYASCPICVQSFR